MEIRLVIPIWICKIIEAGEHEPNIYFNYQIGTDPNVY